MTDDDRSLSAPHTKSGQLQRACLQLIRQHERDDALPTNGRFIFYELEQAGAIPKAYLNERGRKKARQPAQDVSAALMVLRRCSLVPWSWILDETRELAEWQYAASVYEYAVECLNEARIDCWGGRPPPLIICESRATKGVLERIAAEYLCPITATNGQCGGFIVTDIVPKLGDNDREVLYIGDCEIGGPADQIEENTRRYIEEHSDRVFNAQTWSRVALTREQVNRNPRLRRLIIEKLDRRYKPPRPYQAIECEAVGQVALERMLRARLDSLLPEPLTNVQGTRDPPTQADRGAAAEGVMSARPRFVITFSPATGTNGVRALRLLLKAAKRRFGLIATDLYEDRSSPLEISNRVADEVKELRDEVISARAESHE